MRFRHYKGDTYTLVAEATHSETLEKMVVYRKGTEFWVRPAEMFYGMTESGVRRFEPLAFTVLLIEVDGRMNRYRQVDMTKSELDVFKVTKNAEKFRDFTAISILPDGKWDYIHAHGVLRV